MFQSQAIKRAGMAMLPLFAIENVIHVEIWSLSDLDPAMRNANAYVAVKPIAWGF
jgi:hypothetical protein